MIMALVTGLLAAAGLLCLLPACLPGKGGRGLEGKGERDKALFLSFHRSFATASHVAPRCPLCGLALCYGGPWRCTNWVHNYVLQRRPR